MRPRLTAWIASLALIACATAAGASEPRALDGSPPLNVLDLDETRGGLRTPDGIEFGFGAVVRSFVDGQLALETRVTWTDQGPVQTVGDAGLSALAADTALPDGGDGWRGLVVPGEGGTTTFLQRLDDGSVRNVILNTANNRDLRQETEVTLNIPELTTLQRDAVAAQVGARLDQAVSAALSDVAAH